MNLRWFVLVFAFGLLAVAASKVYRKLEAAL